MKRKLTGESKGVKIKKKKTGESNRKILSAEEREKKKTSLYRAPTTEELSELRENEDLYKNNLFRMQIQYLLEEVRLQEKKLKTINKVLHSLNSFLKALPAQNESIDVSDVDQHLPEGFSFPLPELISQSKLKGVFQFLPPKEMKVVGSFLLKTTIKAHQVVDVAVEMPAECLRPRDFLNFRYLHKRALFLTWLASSLGEWEHTEDLDYVCGCDAYKPLLRVKLKGKIGKRWSISLHTSIPDGFFKLSRYAPLKNNVRSAWYLGHDTETTEEIEFPTTRYNNSILRDMLYETHLQDLYNAQKECPAMKDAVCLFKVWLKQRSYKGDSLFTGFIGSMLIVYLLSIRKISSQMSSYQIFRLVLNFVATSDWTKDGISLCKEAPQEAKLQDFHAVFDVVFVDSSGHLNLCADVDATSYNMLKYQAKLSLEHLDGGSIHAFECLFIKSQTFLQSFDHSFRLTNLESLKSHILGKDEHNIIDVGGDWTRLTLKHLVPVLQQGLGERVYRIVPKCSRHTEWNVQETRPSLRDKTFWFGIHLNNELSDNVLVMGPAADKPEAKQFREFWGAKSELRRFQDGSINEAVLWNCINQTNRGLICEKIIKYLLPLHCGISLESISYHGNEFDDVLCTPPLCKTPAQASTGKQKKYVRGCGEEESVHVIKTFDELSKNIRSMEDVPLRINAIHPIDAAMRLTTALTPRQYQTKRSKDEDDKRLLRPKLDQKSPMWCPAYKALIQFETSGKWPDDVQAIQHIKTAFHLKLGESIRKHLKLPAVATPLWIDVMKNGYVFRLSVVHYREMVLHKDSVLATSGFMKKHHEMKAKELELLIVKKPLHNSLIHSLNSQYRSYSLTTRLAKRWLCAHMFSDYISEEATELIVASLFLSPAPLHAPNSHMAGFLRFLNCLAKFDWLNEPLIVNLNEQIKKEEYETINESFTTNRAQLPAMFIATSYDQHVSEWTKTNPSSQILRRLKMVAEAALLLLEADFSQESIKQIFRPSLKDYHVIIEIDKQHVSKKTLSADVTSSGYVKLLTGLEEVVANSVLPVVEFDPVRSYLKELREAFSDVALFFHDSYGGLNIGVVWKAASLVPQPFKAIDTKYKQYLEEPQKKRKQSKKDILETKKRMVVPNLCAIKGDFEIMGRGLVANVINM